MKPVINFLTKTAVRSVEHFPSALLSHAFFKSLEHYRSKKTEINPNNISKSNNPGNAKKPHL